MTKVLFVKASFSKFIREAMVNDPEKLREVVQSIAPRSR